MPTPQTIEAFRAGKGRPAWLNGMQPDLEKALADPATRVSIDGTPRGACPIRDLALDPGTHDVRFTFQPTGESSGERLSLRAGERITVRADFSSATPTIRVLR